MTHARGLLAVLASLALLSAATARADGYSPWMLSAEDAAAANATLLPEYLPNHVSEGDAFGMFRLPNGKPVIVIPVIAPYHGTIKPGDPTYGILEILVVAPDAATGPR